MDTLVLVLGRSAAMPVWVLPGYTVREICMLPRRLYPFELVTLRCMGLVEGVADSRPPSSHTSRSFLLAIASTRVESPR